MRTNCGVSHVVKRVSWLVVCRRGSRRRWSAAKVKVMRVRADGPGVVKDGCWAWTEGPGGRATSCGDLCLGTSTSARVHGVTVLTKSRWWSSKLRDSRRLGARAVEDGGDTCRGGRRTASGIAKLASRRSEVVKTPCPSDAPSGRWTKMPLGELSLVAVE